MPGPLVERNADRPEEAPPGGHVILRDGVPGEPDPDLGTEPRTYYWVHRADVEFYVEDPDQAARDAAMAALLEKFDAALASDPSLGGLVDAMEAEEQLIEQDAEEGFVTQKGVLVPVRLEYASTSALG